MRLSVVVPCYNEEDGVLELHRRVTASLETLFAESYEVVLIDDGSKDRTWEIIHSLSLSDPRVVAVRLSRNHGHQLALTSGLSVARGDLVFVLDADLQDPPELIGPMHDMMVKERADVVYGQRQTRVGESTFKKQTAGAFYRLLSRMTSVDIPLDTGDFRLMTKRIADEIAKMPEHDRFIRGLVAWLGFRQVAFQYDRDARFAGTTKYSFRKMLSFATDALVSFSILPLRLATYTGAVLIFVMVLIGLYAIFGWIWHGTTPGWTSLTLLIVFVSAVQFMVLGLIGEYVGRIYIQSKHRPLFMIAEISKSAGTSN